MKCKRYIILYLVIFCLLITILITVYKKYMIIGADDHQVFLNVAALIEKELPLSPAMSDHNIAEINGAGLSRRVYISITLSPKSRESPSSVKVDDELIKKSALNLIPESVRAGKRIDIELKHSGFSK